MRRLRLAAAITLGTLAAAAGVLFVVAAPAAHADAGACAEFRQGNQVPLGAASEAACEAGEKDSGACFNDLIVITGAPANTLDNPWFDEAACEYAFAPTSTPPPAPTPSSSPAA